MSENNFKYCPHCGQKLSEVKPEKESKCDGHCDSKNEGTSSDKKVLKG